MIITLDTNVLVAALHSKRGASYRILKLILDEQLLLALSNQVLLEYNDVLKRSEIMVLHKLSVSEINSILDILVLLARHHAIYYRLRPNLPDEKDNLFVECAFTSQSQYLITCNLKDFQRGELKRFGFNVMTPRDFYQKWRQIHD